MEATLDVPMLLKLIGTVVSFVLVYWLNDLRSKQVRSTARTDAALEKINKNSDRITRLESETITEAESLRMMSEMERRIMDSFKDFRKEFKDDWSEFREDLREDLKDIRDTKK